MKGFIVNGIFKSKNHEYGYKVHYKYFKEDGEKVLYKRVMHISEGEDPNKKTEMLKKAGFNIKLFENDIYLKCKKDEYVNDISEKIDKLKLLNPIIRYLLFIWAIKFVIYIPEYVFF